MIGRVLLDNDEFLVTAGFLGYLKVHIKDRGLTRKCIRVESNWFLAVNEELQKRGVKIEPGSGIFELFVEEFATSMRVPGSLRYKALFSKTPEQTANDYLRMWED